MIEIQNRLEGIVRILELKEKKEKEHISRMQKCGSVQNCSDLRGLKKQVKDMQKVKLLLGL